MCDIVVSINVSKEVAWQRRLARALHMAQGARDVSGMENYEQLHVYAIEGESPFCNSQLLVPDLACA